MLGNRGGPRGSDARRSKRKTLVELNQDGAIYTYFQGQVRGSRRRLPRDRPQRRRPDGSITKRLGRLQGSLHGRLEARLLLQGRLVGPVGHGLHFVWEERRGPMYIFRKLVELCAAVRAAGSWKRYAAEPRVQLVVLRKLAESGRAVATRGVATRLFAPRRRLQAMGSRALPDVLFWKILEFWRTDRDP